MKTFVFIVLIFRIVFASSENYQLSCTDIQFPCRCSKFIGHNARLEILCPLDNQNSEMKILHYEETSRTKLQCTNVNSMGKYQKVSAPINNFPAVLRNVSTQELTIEDCSVTSKDLENFGDIRSLSIEGNEKFEGAVLVEDFFRGVSSQLEVLTISKNQLIDVDRIVFSGMNKLRGLFVVMNRLKVIDGQFSGLQQLVQLDLAFNEIESVTEEAFLGLVNLVSLNVYGNKIVNFGANQVAPLKNLVSLELSNNWLTTLEVDALQHLIHLERFSLRLNSLTWLPEGLFKNNKALKMVQIGSNTNLERLPNALFANLQVLKEVDLDHCNLTQLPDDLFENSTRLEEINLEHNKLSSLSTKLFRDTIKLITLTLNNNEISELENGPFQILTKLTTLDLSNNDFKNVSRLLLRGLKNLESLKMQGNQIRKIGINALPKMLINIDLSHNELRLDGKWDSVIFNGLEHLRSLDLSNNFITEVIQDYSLVNLEMLDMSFNNVTNIDYGITQTLSLHKLQIDLRNNNIETVDFSDIEIVAKEAKNSMNAVILLDNNPLICDCELYDFLRFLDRTMDPEVEKRVTLATKNLTCNLPTKYSGRRVNTIKSTELVCEIKGNCVENCACLRKPFNDTFILDCAGKGLKEVPMMRMPEGFQRTELHFQDNFLTIFDEKFSTLYENVFVLNLSNNLIGEFSWVSDKTKILYLDNNNISRLNDEVVANFSSQVTLHNNPWICDCKALKLVKYVKRHISSNEVNIKCSNTNDSTNQFLEDSFCLSNETIIISAIIALALFVTVPSLIFGVYYRFNREIKVWLYAHQIFLWFVTEENLDKDKIYDAFISYSHLDEGFVIEELVPRLEGSANPFKLCIHVRNFVPGEFIATQIVESIRDSRRTIVVLSSSFLESVWGKLEFRMAHTEAMSEGRARVIVILLGDVDVRSKLDDELRAYMKTNTYVKWGDRWFWDKLFYAMPHQGVKSGRNVNVDLDKIRGNDCKLNSVAVNVDI